MVKELAVVTVAAGMSAMVAMSLRGADAPPAAAVAQYESEKGRDESEESKRLRTELDELRVVVRQLQQRGTHADQPATPERSTALPNDEESMPSDEEVARTNSERTQAHRELLSNIIDSGPSDSSWEARTRAGLEDAMVNGSLPGSAIEYLHCGATLCEARIGHDDTQALDAFDLGFHDTLRGEAGDAMTLRETDGDRVISTVYFSRSGVPLPKRPQG